MPCLYIKLQPGHRGASQRCFWRSTDQFPWAPDPAGTHGKGPTGASSYLDDRMYAFEAVGLLLGGDDLPAERQLAFVQGLLGPLVSQVESHTAAAAMGSLADAQLVQHALIAIAYLSKVPPPCA